MSTSLDVYPPEYWGLDIAQRQTDGPRHQRLRKQLSVPISRYLWVPEDAITFTPPLSAVVYGDGRAILRLTTMFDRPACWYVRIDSRWDAGSPSYAPADAPYIGQYMDLITANLEIEFGDGGFGAHDEQEEDERDPYPAINLHGGYSWGWKSWPEEAGPVEPHPYWSHTTIQAVS